MKIFSTENKYFDLGILIIRIGLGISYIIIHGAPKITGGPHLWTNIGGALSNFGIDFFPVFWGLMAAISEFFGGMFMLLGLFFRLALVLICVTMVVAFAQGLSNGLPFNKAIYPIELLVVLAGLLYTGPGRISLDNIIFNRNIK